MSKMKIQSFFIDTAKSTLIALLLFLMVTAIYLFVYFWNGSQERSLIHVIERALARSETLPVSDITNFSWDRVCWFTSFPSSRPEMTDELLQEWLRVDRKSLSLVPRYLRSGGIDYIPRTVVVILFMDQSNLTRVFLLRNPKVRISIRSNPVAIPIYGSDYWSFAPDWFTNTPKYLRDNASAQNEYRQKRNDYRCANRTQALLVLNGSHPNYYVTIEKRE